MLAVCWSLCVLFDERAGGHGGAADAKQSAFMTSLAYDFMFATLTKNAEEMDADNKK